MLDMLICSSFVVMTANKLIEELRKVSYNASYEFTHIYLKFVFY